MITVEVPRTNREKEACDRATADIIEASFEVAARAGRIKDSGERRQFETGAVRDIQEGKGRCDLMPLEVVADIYCTAYDKRDLIFEYISEFINNNYVGTTPLCHAIYQFDILRYGCYETMMLEVSKHFEEGAKKYAPNNWKMGIPAYCYIDSAVRHYLKWKRGDEDEPHDRAFVWNLMCCIWEIDYSPRAKEKEASNAD